ncbi:unnamed protein product [Brassicogethes aeneus]|uniref:Thioredoxin domain-containing protein n=1 Tax=Brassicogethes aeneus TaxID=1431903 RepID=A0A9P0BI46_BRAAE|nr:unnamed protein product [Brassicogethes aeneus]
MISDNNANADATSSSSSDSSEESDQEVIDQIDEQSPTISARMLNVCKEFAVFALVVVTYAALTNDPPKITKSPAAYPFFPKNSTVKDWYKGQISKGIELARSADVTIMMFYAPWSAESQSAREEFEKAAVFMQKYVTFAAVNCWQPNSECKQQYNKVYKWPVLVAYPSHGRGIPYTGPLESMHIIKFLQGVCNPIERQLEDPITDYHDVYITAKLNALPGSPDFASYYLAALRFLEKDPLKTVKFYILPVKSDEPELQLHLWNITLNYPNSSQWTSDDILHWIIVNIDHVSQWVSPSGSKSTLLSNILPKNPTLILFTPRNPLHFSNDYYDMMQLISREYNDCGDIYMHLDLFQIRTQRLINSIQYKKLQNICQGVKDPFDSSTFNLAPESFSNVTCEKNKGICDKTFFTSKNSLEKFREHSQYCQNVDENCFKLKYLRSKYKYDTSMYTGENDHRSAENLQTIHKNEVCRNFLHSENFRPHSFEENVNMANAQDASGLACKVNRSLHFILIDSLVYYHFAERLGVDLNEFVDKTAAVIVNDKMESHYVMRDTVTTESLRNFIVNFTKNYLTRSQRSISGVDSKNTHKFENNLKSCDSKQNKNVCVRELTSETFLPTILAKNKAILVYYYTRQCAFCSGISHAFLTAARKLSLVDNLMFSRIDGDTNVLPWQYTMESFPTIIYFPATKKSESRVFPRNLPITVPNLIGFILTNLDPTMKLNALWSICNHLQFSDENLDCISTLRIETLSQTENTLKMWRRANTRKKQILLHKLKNLKHLHLLLAHKSTNFSYVNSFFNKIHTCPDYHFNKKIKLKDEL